MRQPIRIAILECDEPIGQTKEKYGGYGGVFTALLQAAAKQIAQTDDISEPRLDISAFDVVKTELYPDLAKVDAILLTGSSELCAQQHNTPCSLLRQGSMPSTTIPGC